MPNHRPNTHYRGSCCEWCDDYAQGRAIGTTPPIGDINGVPCADFMCGNPEFCPGTRPISTGGRPQAYSNFMDSDNLDYIDSHSDMDYANHINWFTGKRHNEAHRQSDMNKRINSKYPIPEGCDDLDASITKIDNEIGKVSVKSAGSKGAERVKNRTLNSLESRRIDLKEAYEKEECSQKKLDEQSQEFQQTIMSRFDQQYAREMSREEDDTLMYVALGVGVLVIGAVIVIAR